MTTIYDGELFDAGWERAQIEQAFKADLGDLNAAHALHKAVLPRWGFGVVGPYSNGKYEARVFEQGDDVEQYKATADTPARAWLLAILRAMKERGDE